MMTNTPETDSLPALKFGARQHCKNAVHDAIRDTDHPLSWDECNQVEALVLAEFEHMIAHLTLELFRSRHYIDCLISEVVGDTVRLLRTYRSTRHPMIRNKEWIAKYEAKKNCRTKSANNGTPDSIGSEEGQHCEDGESGKTAQDGDDLHAIADGIAGEC
jgi:hypothetical protein